MRCQTRWTLRCGLTPYEEAILELWSEVFSKKMPTETDFAQILEKLEQKIEAGQADLQQKMEAGQADLQQKMEAGQARTEAKLDQVITRVEALEVGQARLEEQFKAVNQRFEAIDKRWEASDQRLDRLEDTLKRQDNRLWGFLVAFGIALLGLLVRYAFFMPSTY